MLSWYASLVISYESHDKWVDQIIQASLEINIIIAGNTTVQMKISVTNMTISNSPDWIFFFLSLDLDLELVALKLSDDV